MLNSNSDSSDHNFEDVCFLCRRSESKAGRMFHLPNNIVVCQDCMHRTMDMMNSQGFENLLKNMQNNPAMVSGIYNNPNNNPGDSPADVTEESFDKNSDKDTSESSAQVTAVNEDDLKELEKKIEEQLRKTFPNMNMQFVNLSDLQGGAIPNKQRPKSKKAEDVPELKMEDIMPPHKIKMKLDEYVIGQEKAKKILSVAVYNHYKRVLSNAQNEAADETKADGVDIEKSNVLMIGPTGCGKTYLVTTLARLLDVPLAIADATSLTEAGYIGDDIESVISKLLSAAGNDTKRCERGIVFIDEIDKLRRYKSNYHRDISGEAVQQGMLKLLEGSKIEVPVGANSKNAMVPLTTIDTKNILFICGGAFPDLEDIVKQRVRKQSSIGFDARIKDKSNEDEDRHILEHVKAEDLRKYGMVPEFLGRMPILCTLHGLDRESLVAILKEPRNAILKQYVKLLELDEVQLEFEDGALDAIAEKALSKETGARGLRAMIEELMLDIMYEVPKDDNIGKVVMTREYIEGTGAPLIGMRGQCRISAKSAM